MASGVNKVILVGTVGKDPECRYVQSGSAVCTLRLACSERRKVKDEWQEVTEWIDAVCFGKTAESAGQYLTKGKQVYVEGRLQTRKYEKDGKDVYKTEVIVNQLIFLGGGQGSGSQKPSGNGKSRAPADAPPADGGFVDEDLPFSPMRDLDW